MVDSLPGTACDSVVVEDLKDLPRSGSLGTTAPHRVVGSTAPGAGVCCGAAAGVAPFGRCATSGAVGPGDPAASECGLHVPEATLDAGGCRKGLLLATYHPNGGQSACLLLIYLEG